LSAILTEPPTIYRTEFGSGAKDGVTSLTAYEVASELSFMLADTIPDDALLAAAKAKLEDGKIPRTPVASPIPASANPRALRLGSARSADCAAWSV
jgi:uncharacterized protein DUF1592